MEHDVYNSPTLLVVRPRYRFTALIMSINRNDILFLISVCPDRLIKGKFFFTGLWLVEWRNVETLMTTVALDLLPTK